MAARPITANTNAIATDARSLFCLGVVGATPTDAVVVAVGIVPTAVVVVAAGIVPTAVVVVAAGGVDVAGMVPARGSLASTTVGAVARPTAKVRVATTSTQILTAVV